MSVLGKGPAVQAKVKRAIPSLTCASSNLSQGTGAGEPCESPPLELSVPESPRRRPRASDQSVRHLAGPGIALLPATQGPKLYAGQLRGHLSSIPGLMGSGTPYLSRTFVRVQGHSHARGFIFIYRVAVEATGPVMLRSSGRALENHAAPSVELYQAAEEPAGLGQNRDLYAFGVSFWTEGELEKNRKQEMERTPSEGSSGPHNDDYS